MDSAQVGILEQRNEVRLNGLLQSTTTNSRRLEAEVHEPGVHHSARLLDRF
jgi:hypothetical protein